MNAVDLQSTLLSDEQLAKAVALLRAGQVVAFPTETVYGLGADSENPTALARLYAIKGRPSRHPVIVHLGNASELDQWAINIPETAKTLAYAFWPGPLTLILPRASRVPDAVTGGQDTVGLRVPDHPVALQLLKAFGGGLAAPSANRFGRISPTSAAHVENDLGTDVSLILDGGACRVGVESTIVAFAPDGLPVILRPGNITAEQIDQVLRNEACLSQGAENITVISDELKLPLAIRAPGTLASHYAPRTSTRLVLLEKLPAVLQAALDAGQSVGLIAISPTLKNAEDYRLVRAETDAAHYAQHLYARLRLLDAAGLDLILIEAVPTSTEWAAVRDRLQRAAYQD